MKQLLLAIMWLATPFLLLAQPSFTSLQGPLGADATSFYVDEGGKYWLGTGSSGGVYTSEDSGNTWQAVNEGIGTVHVSWIGEIEGQLYIEIFDQVQAIATGKPFRCYQYQQEKNAWERITDNAKNDALIIQMQAEIKAREQKMEAKFPLTYGRHSLMKESIINSPDLSTGGNQYKRILGFSDKLAGNTRYKQTFPRDAYQLRGGNLYEGPTGELFVLSRSGVYLLQGYDFRLLGDAGLEATDVTHLANIPSKGTYAIVNRQDIYYRLQGNWYPVYKASNMPSDEAFVEYSQRINRHANGKVLTCMQGHIRSLEETVARLIRPRIRVVDATAIAKYKDRLRLSDYITADGSLDIYFANAAYDSDGSIWAVALIKTKNDFMYEGFLAHITDVNKLPELSRVKGLTRYGMVTSNPVNNEVWLFTEKYAKQINSTNDEVLLNSMSIMAMQENRIAIANDGEMACYRNDNLVTWDASEQQASILPISNADSLSVQCIGFGTDGQVYAGTGYDFLPPGFCGAGLSGIASGLYYLNGTEWTSAGNQHPNPWIMAIAPAHDGGLVVGSSGSSAYRQELVAVEGAPAPYKVQESNGKLGVTDTDGDWIVPQEYDRIDAYTNGVFAFVREGEISIYQLARIDEEGSVTFAPNEAQKLTDIGGGFFLMGETGAVQIIDSDMLPVVKGLYERYTYDYSKQIVLHGNIQDVLMHKADGQWHVKRISRKIEELTSIKGWLIAENDQEGIFEKDATTSIIPMEYDSLRIVNEMIVAYQEDKVGAMSVYTQEWVVPLKYKEVKREGNFLTFKKGVNNLIVHSNSGGSNGESFDFVTQFGTTPFYKVKKGDQWGLLKEMKGVIQTELPVEYSQIMGMNDAKQQLKGNSVYNYLLIVKDGKSGIWNRLSSKQAVPLQYESIELLEYGLFKVKKQGLWGVFKEGGMQAFVPVLWEDVQLFSLDHNLIQVKKAGKWGLYDTNSQNLALPCSYDELSVDLLEKKLIITRVDTKKGIVSTTDFQEVLTPSLQTVEPFDTERLLVKKEGKYSFFSIDTKIMEMLPGLEADFKQTWEIAGEALSPQASMRVINQQLFLPMPLRKRITKYSVVTGEEVASMGVNKLNRQGQLTGANNRVLFTDGASIVFSYQEDGQGFWAKSAFEDILFEPIIGKFGPKGELQVALILKTGRVMGMDLATGEATWKYDTGINPEHITSPLAMDINGDKIDELVFHTTYETEGDCIVNLLLVALNTKDGSTLASYEVGCDTEAGALLGIAQAKPQVLAIDRNELMEFDGGKKKKSNTVLGKYRDPDIINFVVHPQSQVVFGVEEAQKNTSRVPYIVSTAINEPAISNVGEAMEDEFFGEGDSFGDGDLDLDQIERYHIGKVTAPPFIADLMGTGTAQVGFVSESGVLLLLDAGGQLLKAYQLPVGTHTMPWVGDADGDGNNDLIIADQLGQVTFYKGNHSGKVYWGEWRGNMQSTGVIKP